MVIRKSIKDSMISLPVEHDQIAKWGLKDKARFKSFLEFGLSPEKFKSIDFSRLEFIDTEILQKEISGRFRMRHADVIAKVGLKGLNTDALIAIIVEHKSHKTSEKKLFLQALNYSLALLEINIYPIMTVLLLHRQAPVHISSDLQTAFHLTSEVRKLFKASALNFSPDVIDLRKESEEDIKNKAGNASALCYTLKVASDMTKRHIKSVFELCKRDSKSSAGYREYASVLCRYMLQSTNYERSVFDTLEQEVITSKEDQIMISTASRLFNEGIEKGREEGMEEGREEGIEKGMERGREEGMEKGIGKGREEVALRMLQQNMELQLISQVTDISIEQLQKLKK